jgi:hypothetical protein
VHAHDVAASAIITSEDDEFSTVNVCLIIASARAEPKSNTWDLISLVATGESTVSQRAAHTAHAANGATAKTRALRFISYPDDIIALVSRKTGCRAAGQATMDS